MTNLTIENTETGDDVELYNVQESQRQIAGDTSVDSLFNSERGDALISQLTGSETAVVTGLATGNRISKNVEYSNDPEVALAEWALDLEATCHSRQGDAHTLVDDDRDDTRKVIVRDVMWQREQGSPFEVQYAATLGFGDSPVSFDAPDTETANPSSAATLDGVDMGTIAMKMVEIEQPVDKFSLAFAEEFDQANSWVADGGSTRSFTVTGEITGATERNDFDEHVRSLVGNNESVTYTEAWPGRSLDVVVGDYESTHEAGNTRLGSYNITLIEGRTL